MQHNGVAKIVSQTALKWTQHMPVKRETVAIHPPLRWRVIYSRRLEVVSSQILIPSLIL